MRHHLIMFQQHDCQLNRLRQLQLLFVTAYFLRFVPVQIQKNISLKPYNTFAVNAKAKYFSTFSSVNELEELLKTTNDKRRTINNKLILGGRRIIKNTKDIDGLAINNALKGID